MVAWRITVASLLSCRQTSRKIIFAHPSLAIVNYDFVVYGALHGTDSKHPILRHVWSRLTQLPASLMMTGTRRRQLKASMSISSVRLVGVAENLLDSSAEEVFAALLLIEPLQPEWVSQGRCRVFQGVKLSASLGFIVADLSERYSVVMMMMVMVMMVVVVVVVYTAALVACSGGPGVLLPAQGL
jgi:hypothetical protein